MSKFRTGISEIKKTAAGGGKRKFSPSIYWAESGESKTLAWLTSASEIPKVDLHMFVKVPDDSRDTGFRFEHFLCRKDESMRDDSGGYCELCDRVGHEAGTKFVGQALELIPTKEGKKVTKLEISYVTKRNKDGVEVDYPQWGLVFQAARNFMSYLAAYEETTGDITEVGWEVVREGTGQDTKYHHFELKAPLPDLSSLELPSILDILEEMGSDEKYAMVSAIAAGSQPPPRFGKKDSEDNSGRSPSRDEEFEKIRKQLVSNPEAVETY